MPTPLLPPTAGQPSCPTREPNPTGSDCITCREQTIDLARAADLALARFIYDELALLSGTVDTQLELVQHLRKS